jgi:hypothetical protein
MLMKSTLNISIVAVFMAAICLTGCSNSLHFLPSTTVPGAEGKVKVKTDKNENYAISVDVRNLAQPRLLKDPKNAYVVWMETVNNGTQNIGRLTSSRGLFSKAMKGSLETVTPYRPVRFLVTAEDSPEAQYPNDEPVLTSESNLKYGN